jgi:D-lactate dehydrogenase
LAKRVPIQIVEPINSALRTYLGEERIPLWSKSLPSGGAPRQTEVREGADFVLFASCLESIFEADTANSLKSLARKAGLSFTTPAAIGDLCCGTPWKSKGLIDGYESMVEATYKALVQASDNGRLPVICENSSCSEGLITALKSRPGSPLRIIDSIDFAQEFLLPRLEITTKRSSVVLHPTCSSTRLGSNANLEAIAAAISQEVSIPADWGCCAFAGDRGLLHPELTASATRAEVEEIKGQHFDTYLSTNLTCEIGLSAASGAKYQHILVALDEVARGKDS